MPPMPPLKAAYGPNQSILDFKNYQDFNKWPIKSRLTIVSHEAKKSKRQATTEWVIYKEHCQNTRKCSSQAALTAST